jgi:DNA ligase-1
MSITKPMLAADLKGQWDKLVYPVYGTTKLDGIRCLKVKDRGVVSRTFKPIANKHIRETLDAFLPVQSDGEIMAGSTFQETTHNVMSYERTPDFKYYMFDLVREGFESEKYETRMENLKNWYETLTPEQKNIVVLVLPTKLNNRAEVEAYEQECLDTGFEGVIIRSGDSPYKSGRSTLKEGYLVKIKRFEDSEAIILDSEELMNNNNVATKDNFGRTERSSHKDNLSGAGILGTLVVKDCKTGLTFRVGTGFDADQRTKYWNARASLVGQIIKYKFFTVGVKELPRHPVFLGFRSADDMSE